ncbi:MAG: 2-succinyl-6-hydroxy-2,4-cyclohexadiene-1-carboxylate synthase [Gemmatimonadota bacterium]
MASNFPPLGFEPASGLAWRRLGKGPPLLLLHGFTGNAQAWPAVIVESLSQRYTVWIPDLPGHGESPARRAGIPSDFPGALQRLMMGLDALGIHRPVWVGYSMGGRLALGAAVSHGVRVRALVLESASPGIPDSRERRHRLEEDQQLSRRIRTEGMAAFVDGWLTQPLFQSQSRLAPEVREAERDRRLGNQPEELAEALEAMSTGGQPSFWQDLPGVTLPALLVTGNLDPKFGAIAANMAVSLPEARHLTVAGAGHAVHLEAPNEWLRRILPFLDEIHGHDKTGSLGT